MSLCIFIEFPQIARKQHFHLDRMKRSSKTEKTKKRANRQHIQKKTYEIFVKGLRKARQQFWSVQMKGNANLGCMVNQTSLLCKVVQYRHLNLQKCLFRTCVLQAICSSINFGTLTKMFVQKTNVPPSQLLWFSDFWTYTSFNGNNDTVLANFASYVNVLSSEDSAIKQEFIMCVECEFSGVKFSFVVQECGLLLSPL